MADSSTVEVVEYLHSEEAAADQTPQGCFEGLRTRAAGWILNPRPDPAIVESPHPIMVMIREKELGKSVLSFGGAVAIALAISDDKKAMSKTVLGHLVLTWLSVGCMAIWNGIVLRVTRFRRAALVVEQVGIVMVLMSFIAVVASALPVGLYGSQYSVGAYASFLIFSSPRLSLQLLTG